MLRKYRRIIASCLLIFFLAEVLAPTASYALTSGPTAPEATSFEPVDTTDMVNLASGDLAYNIPLLEVPGPSGGYPLSLSYHAGIQPNEDASWVGLGWTLNPGAIVRNVNGFVDDFKSVENATRLFWEGGESKKYSVGVSIGPTGGPHVSAGLSYSQDTYQGSGIGASIGVGVGITNAFGIDASVGVSPYGDPYASAGVSLSAPLMKGEQELVGASASLGISTNFKTVDAVANVGIDYGLEKSGDPTKDWGTSLLGVSIASGRRNGSISINLGGSSYFNNSKSGRISTSSTGVGITIPLVVATISLGYQHQRYWIDQTDFVDINGTLYFNQGTVNKAWLDKNAYDTYLLPDPTVDGGVAKNPDPEKVLGGTFPSHDNYYVHAQGLGGYMRPYYFQKHLVSRNNYEVKENSEGDEYNYYNTISYQTGFDTRQAEFRFIGDFSNRFEYAPEEMRHVPDAGHDPGVNPLTFDFNWADDPVIGETGNDTYSSNRLAGSRHTEWLTNSEILTSAPKVGNAGFIETKSTGLNRNALDPNGIGAFIITNETGVKYHFALPVMTADEYSYSENISQTLTFNEFKNPQPYAYTWYLTAVTGPDYVDRGPSGTGDGILNEYDWGYWVEFEYGKWTDQHYWRNPSEGFNRDLDKNFRNFSEGRKELYYLDAIRTKTHTAFFVKEIRHDAKGIVYSYRNISDRFFLPGIATRNKEDITEATKVGGFTPQAITNTCSRVAGSYTDEGSVYYYSRPTSALKLNKIFLLKNEDVNSMTIQKSSGSDYAQAYSYNWNVVSDEDLGSNPLCTECQECDFSALEFNHHLYQNVLDVYDIQSLPIESKSLRVIDFNTDYSLSPNTANSFDFNLVNMQYPSQDAADYPKFGKLTLNSIQFRGKSGEALLPPMQFGYDYETPERGFFIYLNIDSGNYSFDHKNSGLLEGDIIVWGDEEKYYGLVEKITGVKHDIRIIGENTPASEGYIAWAKTKNPPYDKDLYDCWGLYKSDLDKSILSENEDAARLVSPVSARNLDVWSLRHIVTSLGAEVSIDYEADAYKKPVLTKNQILRIASIEPMTGQNYQITIYDDVPDLDRILAVGSSVDFRLFFGDPYIRTEGLDVFTDFDRRIEEGSLTVTSVIRDTNNKWVITTAIPSGYFDERPDTGDKAYGPPVLLAGNISHDRGYDNLGGGIRVKEIGTSSILLSAHTTTYHYNVNGGVESSGNTTYEPGGLDQAYYYFPGEGDPLYDFFDNADDVKEAKESYQGKLNEHFYDVLAIAREIPPPGVVYEYVTVRASTTNGNEVVENPNYSTYHFEVFSKGMVGISYSTTQTYQYPGEHLTAYGFIGHDKLKVRTAFLKNYSSRVGSLKSITLFDVEGNKISETTNEYLHDAVSPELIPQGQNDETIEDDFEANIKVYEPSLASGFGNQGVIEETFAEARYARQDYQVTVDIGIPVSVDAFNLLGVVSKREEFPTIQIGQTTINYKTGIKTESSNLSFDFYSGQVTKALVEDGYGNSFITEVTPAYRVYEEMGLAAEGGKNMLMQEAGSFSFKVDDQNVPIGLVGGSVQTWSDGIAVSEEGVQPGIWRKHASYSFIGDDNISLGSDGLYPYAGFEPFNFDNPGANFPKWQKNGEITFYDVHSHALEATDINGNFAATRMSLDQTRVLATAANAGYDEFTFAGVEDENVNGVGGGVITQGSVNTTTAHTGSKSVQAGNGLKAFTYTFDPKQRTYHVSVWSSQDQVAIKYRIGPGSTQTANSVLKGEAENWYLFEADIELTSDPSELEVWCEATNGLTVFDDFRVHPLDAAMTSYVYNEWGELSHILDNNNLYTEYQYDGMGRLKEIFKESFQNGKTKTSEIRYHYAKQTN